MGVLIKINGIKHHCAKLDLDQTFRKLVVLKKLEKDLNESL